MKINLITNIDFSILDFIQNNLRSAFGDIFFPFITMLNERGEIWISIALIFFIFKKTRKLSIVILISLAFSALFGNLVLKPIFERARPFLSNPSIVLLINAPKGYSFPSGHTITSFASAVPIFMFSKKLGIPALILASLIAFSRLYLYVHFPTDVLAGILLGTCVSIIIYKFAFKKAEYKLS